MTLDETQCLGCVYIVPTGSNQLSRTEIGAIDDHRWADVEVVAYFWVRKSRLADELDGRLLTSLGSWLERDWNIDCYVFACSEQYEHQLSVFESAGLRLMFRLKNPNESGARLRGCP